LPRALKIPIFIQTYPAEKTQFVFLEIPVKLAFKHFPRIVIQKVSNDRFDLRQKL